MTHPVLGLFHNEQERLLQDVDSALHGTFMRLFAPLIAMEPKKRLVMFQDALSGIPGWPRAQVTKEATLACEAAPCFMARYCAAVLVIRLSTAVTHSVSAIAQDAEAHFGLFYHRVLMHVAIDPATRAMTLLLDANYTERMAVLQAALRDELQWTAAHVSALTHGSSVLPGKSDRRTVIATGNGVGAVAGAADVVSATRSAAASTRCDATSSVAASAAGSGAGSTVGSEAGSEVGSEVGSEAGSEAGTEVGSEAGYEAAADTAVRRKRSNRGASVPDASTVTLRRATKHLSTQNTAIYGRDVTQRAHCQRGYSATLPPLARHGARVPLKAETGTPSGIATSAPADAASACTSMRERQPWLVFPPLPGVWSEQGVLDRGAQTCLPLMLAATVTDTATQLFELRQKAAEDAVAVAAVASAAQHGLATTQIVTLGNVW